MNKRNGWSVLTGLIIGTVALSLAAQAAPITAIAAGGAQSLFLKSDGTLWTCGNNMGNGSWIGSPIRQQVPGLANVTSMAGGYSHSLAVANGAVYAWGENGGGWLGDGTTTDSATPVVVSGLSSITRVAGGVNFSMALKSDGTVWTWGRNTIGQLGNNTTNSSTTPVQIVGFSGVSALACGDYHAVVLKTDGTVWTWGNNDYGELGNDIFNAYTNHPVQAAALSGVQAVAAGSEFSMALKSDGTVWTWGQNNVGQLGLGTTVTTNHPMQAATLSGITAIAAAGNHAHALKSDGTVWSWGGNGDGQCGISTNLGSTSTPTQVTALSGIMAIAAGDSFLLALDSNGAVWSCGYNMDGQLGNGQIGYQVSPVQALFSGATPVTSIAAGMLHSLALKSDRTAWSWGFDFYGRPLSTNTPTQVSELANVVSISGGMLLSVAAKSDGTVWSWGLNSVGQMGIGNSIPFTNVPVQVVSLGSATNVACGMTHAAAVRNTDGTVWCWGSNDKGQLGNGNNIPTNSPVATLGLAGVRPAMAAGWSHTLNLLADGSVASWGMNASGQLGNGGTGDLNFPTLASGLVASKIACGANHSMAIKSDGTLMVWGDNVYGQLGLGNTNNALAPVAVPGMTNIIAMAGGVGHSLAVKSDGTVWAWGDNTYGQLGIGTFRTNSLVPVQVLGVSDAVAVAASMYHSMALKSDGTVMTWGIDIYGQLGVGFQVNRYTPTKMVQYATLNIDVSPAGGTWTISTYPADYTGPTSGVGDATITNVAIGSYVVTFGSLAGYRTPAASTNAITDGDTVTASGRYRLYQHYGDFDGDGYADPVLYTLADGTWQVMMSSLSYALASGQLGGAGFLPVPGDFDLDHKTDVVVFQESTGHWNFLLSGRNYQQANVTLGGPGSVAVAADFDADRKADPTVYFESTGHWVTMLSGSSYATLNAMMGGAGWLPVSGDFDADGKSDPAVYNETTGGWQVLLSQFGYALATATFGGDGWYPVIGDFDGDGKADPATYQESTGVWRVMASSMNYMELSDTLGGPGFVPVSGDFDADGKTDLAVYKEATGAWQVIMSSSGASASATFGGPGRMP